MRVKIPIDYNNPHKTNQAMREFAEILFPGGRPSPMPYTIDSNSTHYIIEIKHMPEMTPELERKIFLWKLRQ